MEAYQQRVIEEKSELDERISKLDAFIANSQEGKVSKVTLFLLEKQLEAMFQYSRILDIRISLFEVKQSSV